jgi:hypothetical protein
MSNTYNATGVTVSRAFPPIEPLIEVLIRDGKGEFIVNGPEDHQLVITSGNFSEGGAPGAPVTVRGLASVNPPAIGSFLINETMTIDTYDVVTQRATFTGPIVLAPMPEGVEALSGAASS